MPKLSPSVRGPSRVFFVRLFLEYCFSSKLPRCCLTVWHIMRFSGVTSVVKNLLCEIKTRIQPPVFGLHLLLYALATSVVMIAVAWRHRSFVICIYFYKFPIKTKKIIFPSALWVVLELAVRFYSHVSLFSTLHSFIHFNAMRGNLVLKYPFCKCSLQSDVFSYALMYCYLYINVKHWSDKTLTL